MVFGWRSDGHLNGAGLRYTDLRGQGGFDPPQPQMIFNMAIGPVMSTANAVQQLGGYAFARKACNRGLRHAIRENVAHAEAFMIVRFSNTRPFKSIQADLMREYQPRVTRPRLRRRYSQLRKRATVDSLDRRQAP
jgi:hypothetical protein